MNKLTVAEMNKMVEKVNEMKLIPLSEITKDAREIAVAWIEGYEDWMKDDLPTKHKLASDIMNYANEQNKKLTTENARLREALEVETKKTKKLTRGIDLCLAAINGGLDGLELDNTCDVTENSFIIQQLKDQSEILTQALTNSQ